MGICSWLFFKTPPGQYRQIRQTRMKWKLCTRERLEVQGHNHDFVYRTQLSLCRQPGDVTEECDQNVARQWHLYLFQSGDFSLYCMSTVDDLEAQPIVSIVNSQKRPPKVPPQPKSASASFNKRQRSDLQVTLVSTGIASSHRQVQRLMNTEPLKNNLEAISYEMIERDSVKYIQYQRAIAKAFKDWVSNEKASELTTILMVVGAGRGSLVTASLQVAEETGRKLKVYAVEKNPDAVVTLHDFVKTRGWEGTVTIISCDMRFCNAPERADILVSELLGSFGYNELFPECLDGAQRFLKPDGISTPLSYTSFIQTLTTSKLYNDVASLAPSQPVFTFTHPNLSRKPNNQCYKKLCFNLPSDMGSALVHGFAGYFKVVLCDDVHLSIELTTTLT